MVGAAEAYNNINASLPCQEDDLKVEKFFRPSLTRNSEFHSTEFICKSPGQGKNCERKHLFFCVLFFNCSTHLICLHIFGMYTYSYDVRQDAKVCFFISCPEASWDSVMFEKKEQQSHNDKSFFCSYKTIDLSWRFLTETKLTFFWLGMFLPKANFSTTQRLPSDSKCDRSKRTNGYVSNRDFEWIFGIPSWRQFH